MLLDYWNFFEKNQFSSDSELFIFQNGEFIVQDNEKAISYTAKGKVIKQFVGNRKAVHVFENSLVLIRNDSSQISLYSQNSLYSIRATDVQFNKMSYGRNCFIFNDEKRDVLLPFGDGAICMRKIVAEKFCLSDDDFDIKNVEVSPLYDVYLSVVTKNGGVQNFILVAKMKDNTITDFEVRMLPRNVREVYFLKNGNYILRYDYVSGTSLPIGCQLFTKDGELLISSDEDYGILDLGGWYCKYQNALIIDPEGLIEDEYKGELAVSRNGVRIFPYKTLNLKTGMQGFWPGGKFKLFSRLYGGDIFCFWESNRFYLSDVDSSYKKDLKLYTFYEKRCIQTVPRFQF